MKSKISKKDIYKEGADFKVTKLDFNDPEVIKIIEEVKRKQTEILKRKEVDINLLRNTIINI